MTSLEKYIQRYMVIDNGRPQRQEDDDGDSMEHVYENIDTAWVYQEEGQAIVKVGIEEIAEVEILYNWKCPQCDDEVVGLKEGDKIFCTDCKEWQEDDSKNVWDDLDSITKRIIQLTLQRVMAEGKNKDEVMKIMKHFISKTEEKEKEETDAA